MLSDVMADGAAGQGWDEGGEEEGVGSRDIENWLITVGFTCMPKRSPKLNPKRS